MAWNDNKFDVYSTQYECDSHCYILELDQSSKDEVRIITHDIQDDQDDDVDDDDEEGGEGIEAKERRRSVEDAEDAEDDDESRSNSFNDSASSVASDDKNTQTASAIPLDNEGKRAAHRNNLMHVTTITPRGGHIQGTLRPSYWVIRLHDSDQNLLVHAARFGESLGPMHAKSWVRDASNNILGSIISVGFFKGSEITLIMPVKEVFEYACKELNPTKTIDQEIVGGPECVPKD